MEDLNKILDGYKPNRIFLVIKKSYELSGAKKIIDPILEPYEIVRFSDFTPNPKLDEIKKGIEIFKKESPDVMIAVGGGSSIDTAKLINCLSAQPYTPEDYIIRKKKLQNKGKPLIVIPTTAGTGSEATHFATVYVDKTKYSLEHKYVLPNHYILEPKFTMSLPPEITASTGIDALCQCIESYWSVNSTEESKKYAKEGIKLIINNLEKVVKEPDMESREAMMKAANLSGKAINISKTTASHAISYPLTSYFGIPHGQAVGLTIGSMLVFNYNVNEKDCLDGRGVNYVKKTIKEIIELLGYSSGEEAKKEIEYLMKNIGLKNELNEFDVSVINNNIKLDRLKNNPRKINSNQIKTIFEGN